MGSHTIAQQPEAYSPCYTLKSEMQTLVIFPLDQALML